MIFYYAMGGGLGHLVRAYIYLQQFNFEDHKVITATASDHLIFPASKMLLVPTEYRQSASQLKKWLAQQIDFYQPARFLVDVFPAGVLGELDDRLLAGMISEHLSRRLKWSKYKNKINIKSPRYQKVMIAEILESEHQVYLDRHGQIKQKLRLDYNYLARLNPIPEKIEITQQETWLIVHSGPAEEVKQLLDYAQELARLEQKKPRYWLFTQSECGHNDGQIEIKTHFPALHYFSAGSRLFTAGGFNSVQLHRYFQGKHHFLPFPRKYDDQFWRVQQVNKGTYW